MESLYRHYQSSHPCHQDAKMNSAADERYFETNFQKFLPRDKQAKIIDIGCGAGYFLQYLEKKGYLNYLGIDVSKEQIDFCKTKHLKGQVVLISNLSRFLQTKENTFDFVIMNDVIEHLPKEEIIPILSLIHQALKSNGVFVVKTANLKHRWGMSVRYMDFTHTTGFTQESLAQVLFLSGFRKTDLIHEVHPIHDIKSLARVMLKSVFELFYRLEYLVSFGTLSVDVGNMLIAIAQR